MTQMATLPLQKELYNARRRVKRRRDRVLKMHQAMLSSPQFQAFQDACKELQAIEAQLGLEKK